VYNSKTDRTRRRGHLTRGSLTGLKLMAYVESSDDALWKMEVQNNSEVQHTYHMFTHRKMAVNMVCVDVTVLYVTV